MYIYTDHLNDRSHKRRRTDC